MHPIVFVYLISLALNVVTSGISGLFLFFSAVHDRAARALAYGNFGWAIWAASHFVAIVAPTKEISVLAWQIGMFGLLAGCVFFADFAARLVEEHNKVSYRTLQRILYTIALAIAGIFLSDILLETNIILSSSVGSRLWFDMWLVPGRFLTAFIGFFLLCFSLAYIYFFLGYKQSDDKVFRQTILLLFWTTILPAIGGSTQYLVWYNVPLPPLGGFTIPIYVLGVLYAVTRFHLFNGRVITAELFTTIIWMITFGRVLLARDSFEFIISMSVFLLTLFFGLLTIRSVITEVKQKDSLEGLTKELDHANKNLADLNVNLEAKVASQTEEIRKAYEVEKKARIELEELDKAKDQFILTTQHHLRTPLTIVKGFIELSLDEKITERMRIYLQKANENVLRMTDLVNEFLNVSKQENSGLNFNRESVDIAVLLPELKAEFIPELERKHLAFNLSFTTEAAAARVFVEKKSIRAALFNIIDNAIKYTSAGRVSIEGAIILHPIEKTQRLQIKISDTGIGISEKELPGLFNRFFEQGEEAQIVNATGKGIGLTFSKNIINAYGGNITAESEGAGKGTTFIIELPLM